MFAKSKKIVRQYIGKDIQDFMEIPSLIDIQLSSYESFIQKERLDKKEPLLEQGLQEVFTSTFPIKSQDENMSLEYEFYELGLGDPYCVSAATGSGTGSAMTGCSTTGCSTAGCSTTGCSVAGCSAAASVDLVVDSLVPWLLDSFIPSCL